MNTIILSRINNISMRGKTHKNVDNGNNIRYATVDNHLKPLDKDCFVRNFDIGDIMGKDFSSNDVSEKINEFCYEGIDEPEYAKKVSESDEYNCANNISKYYDENNVLRKKTTVFNNDLLLNLCIYNKSGFLTYEANVGFPQSGDDVSIGRFYYDGTKDENLLKTAHVSFNRDE